MLASIIVVLSVTLLGALTCWWFRCRAAGLRDKESDYRSHSSSSANYYDGALDASSPYCHGANDAILRQQLTRGNASFAERCRETGKRLCRNSYHLAGSSVLPMTDFGPWTVSGLVEDAALPAPDGSLALRVVWEDVGGAASASQISRNDSMNLNRSASLGSKSNDSDALGAVAVTSFGPSESIDTELW